MKRKVGNLTVDDNFRLPFGKNLEFATSLYYTGNPTTGSSFQQTIVTGTPTDRPFILKGGSLEFLLTDTAGAFKLCNNVELAFQSLNSFTLFPGITTASIVAPVVSSIFISANGNPQNKEIRFPNCELFIPARSTISLNINITTALLLTDIISARINLWGYLPQ